MVKKLKNNLSLASEYQKIIDSQLESGTIERADENEICEVGKVCYLPHKAVVREDKETTKARVVFDASAKAPERPCLNDCMHAGPSLLPNLMDILMRFRLNKVGLISDIEKAFLNISVSPDQRDFLRFLWVDSVESPEPKIVTFRYKRLLFGAICSPYLLNATVRHHLENYREEDGDFVDNVVNSLYCDDFVSSFDSEEEAFAQYNKLKSCFRDANLNLRKWKSNCESLSERISCVENTGEQTQIESRNESEQIEQKSSPSLSEQHQSYEKVLGLIWDRQKDTLKFDFEEILKDVSVETVTKRSILSSTAKIFDPLGVLSPVVIMLKILFQQICKEKCDWDTSVKEDVKENFVKVISDLKLTESAEFERPYFSSDDSKDIVNSVELHGFSDASTKAYGACVYIVYRMKTGESVVSLVAAKTKVAPIDGETIPRLELLAALILARLISSVKAALQGKIEITQTYSWCDSQITLFWILKTGKVHKPFIENRVNEIRKIVPPQQWKYCPTDQNPADIASRGQKASILKESKRWWEGPEFLKQSSEFWPSHKNFDNDVNDDSHMPDTASGEFESSEFEEISVLKVDAQNNCHIHALLDVSGYSNIQKLLRIIGFVLRFVNNLRAKLAGEELMKGELITDETNAALNLVIKSEQSVLKSSANYKDLKKNLAVFEDENGFLRCKGRIENAPLPYETRFPILIPRDREIAKLLVLDAHQIVKHDGVKETLAQLRSQYWMVRGRQYVRKIIARCSICARFEGRSYEPPRPPPLPKFRVSDDSAFTRIGIDFAGPIYVKNIYGHENETHKAYILLITCASTRGVHLELVPDLGGPSLMRGLSRFQARRGVPYFVISDNGKTFKDKNIRSYLRRNGIRWDFNVASCPWSGGFFERLVRSVKRCLRKTLRNARVTYEEFLTILTEVEGVINSRPLTYCNEELGEILTPSHLMIGRRILDRPSPIDDVTRNTDGKTEIGDVTRRAKHLQNVLNHFRGRFRREYLTELREHHRCKRSKKREKINVGDIVTIFEDKIPRQRWNLGRVEKLLSSADGEIRSAVVRVSKSGRKSGTLRRPIARLYPVEVCEENDVAVNAEEHEVRDEDGLEPEIKFIADQEVRQTVEKCK